MPTLDDLVNDFNMSSNPNYSRLPTSNNVDDRRGFSLANLIADYVQRGRVAMSEPPDPNRHSLNTIFPSGPFASDIAATAQRGSFESQLQEMQRREEAKRMLAAYYDSANPSSFNTTPPAIAGRRR